MFILIEAIKGMNTANIQDKEVLDYTVQLLTSNTKRIWYKYSKIVNIQRSGGMTNVSKILKIIDHPKILMIGNNSKVQLKR